MAWQFRLAILLQYQNKRICIVSLLSTLKCKLDDEMPLEI